jgi:phosphonate transport system permease protein
MLGTLIGIGLSLVAGKYACRHLASRWMATAIRSFVAVVRTVPELIWGLLFVACFGLGPFAGVLAVAADTFGFCGRFFTEAFDDVEDRDLEGLRGLGASPFGQFLALIVPQSLPNLIHTSLYALERAVRASIVLGLVGAGGIGVELDVAMRLFRYDEASTIMLLILVLVLLIERISELVRRRIRPYSQAS